MIGKILSILKNKNKNNFKLLNGKIYKPSQLEEELIFAFEKKYNNDDIIDEVKVDCSSFEVYKIGDIKK